MAKLKISIFGDSISTLDGTNPPDYAVFYDAQNQLLADVLSPDDTWWGMVINALDGELLMNNSWSGSTVFKHPLYEVDSYGCSDARTSLLGKNRENPDIIFIFLGTNDWGFGVPIQAPIGHQEDCYYFVPAYSTMLKKVKNNYPNAKIYALSLARAQCTKNPSMRIDESYFRNKMIDYSNAIKDCAKTYDADYIDILTGEDYDSIDGVHPTRQGMKTIAEKVINALKKR